MKVTPTAIPDAFVIEPKVFGDACGFFYESFNQKAFSQATALNLNLNLNFVQDNHCGSAKGVLQGPHYQIQQPQGKLVRVLRGAVFDAAVDIRKASPTFSKWVGMELTGENYKQLWIPAGFAHGFIMTSDSVEFLYKTTDYYLPEHELCIAWDDPGIGIQWPLTTKPSLAAKDQQGLALCEGETFRRQCF